MDRIHIERTRWPDGPVCPHCGSVNEASKVNPKPDSKKPVRKGVWWCRKCEKQFTVTVGTIFEDSHIPLHKWLLAIHLIVSSKKGVSAHRLMRNLEIGSYRTAWSMSRRIRWALTEEPVKGLLDGTVEVDETYVRGKLRVGSQADEPGEWPKDRLKGGSMTKWIDDLKQEVEQKKADQARKEQRRLNKDEIIESKIGPSWQELLQQIDVLCSELKNKFPSEERYHFSRTDIPGGFILRHGRFSLPRLTVVHNFGGQCIYVFEGAKPSIYDPYAPGITGKEEITIDVDDDNKLLFAYKDMIYREPAKLARALIEPLCPR